jgi:hypothetical protein
MPIADFANGSAFVDAAIATVSLARIRHAINVVIPREHSDLIPESTRSKRASPIWVSEEQNSLVPCAKLLQ